MKITSQNSVKEFKYYDAELWSEYVDDMFVSFVAVVGQTGKVSGFTRAVVDYRVFSVTII